jgi:hypothetical protein
VNGRKLLQHTLGLTLAVLSLIGCGGSSTQPATDPTCEATATPSPEPAATTTPLPPTDTPTPEPIACMLQCMVVKVKLEAEPNATIYSIKGMVISGGEELDIDGLQAELTCELGEASQRGDRSTEGRPEAITVSVDEERTYADTQRTYRIVGGITYGPSSLSITGYEFTVTGGVFGETAGTCSWP